MSDSMRIARGYEEVVSTQFSVFLANRVGQFKELLDLLAAEGVQVAGVSMVDSTDWAVIRLVVSDPDAARELLGAHKLPFTESDVLLVELEEESSLARVCGHLLAAEINLHFAYPLIRRPQEKPVIVLHVDDPVLATRTLLMHHVKLLGNRDLSEPA